MQYTREITIGILLIAICLVTWKSDWIQRKLNQNQAEQTRNNTIDSVQAGRNDVKERETKTYPEIDKALAEVAAQRAKIKPKPQPERKDVQDEVNKKAQGDIHNLAHMFVLAGYSCSVR